MLFGKKKNNNKKDRELRLIGEDAPFAYVEAYKSLRTNIEFLASTNNYHTFMITSSGPWDGKSTVALNLSAAMGNSGKKVILVDCDLRKGSVGTYLNIRRNVHGISSVLTGKDDLEDAIRHDEKLGIDVLPVGSLPANPAEMIGSEAMVSMMQRLSQTYDYVFIDTPPIAVVTDAAIMSRMCDGVILVVRANETTKQAVTQSKKALEDVNARILGIVFNDVDLKSRNYGSGYYKYSYGYGDNKYGRKKHKKKHAQ